MAGLYMTGVLCTGSPDGNGSMTWIVQGVCSICTRWPVGVRPGFYIQANLMAIDNLMIRLDGLRLKMRAWLVHQSRGVLVTSHSIHIGCSTLTSRSVQDRSPAGSGGPYDMD